MQIDNVIQHAFGLTRKGIVKEVLEDGVILVQEAKNQELVFPCYFLRMSAGEPPVIDTNDEVIFRTPDVDDDYGVVLGIVEKYSKHESKVLKKLSKNSHKNKTTLKDEVLHIKAKDGLVLECGKSTIIMTKDGKVQVKGEDVLSRSKGMNRIKGAGVNIN